MSRETSLLSPSLTLRPRWARIPGCSGSDLDYIEPYIFFFKAQSPHRDFKKKGRLTRAGGDLARKINFYDPQPPKTRSYAEKSTSR